MIKEQVKAMGFNRGGNMAVERVLTNPANAGMVKAKAFKSILVVYFRRGMNLSLLKLRRILFKIN
jgi:hypothetical protein